ncbi:MAG: beta-lactamase family protein [Candidatus Bathyarchaeota archaeon]|nr:MAG: beta-lactamase family protein [Candidatus Bathyarchaeota archaeon]
MTRNITISGFSKPGFEHVREAFAENFERRNELGAACCIFYRGERVVDLWGGVRNKKTGEPWKKDTMVVVFSTTKGMSGLAMALAHSQGLIDYDECVSKYWPMFAQQGKERITVRQLFAHQAGLFALDEPVDKTVIADLDKLAVILAKQKPAWEPGTRQAYHALTLGFYQSEILRRVDPRHRSLGQYFQDEIADPLGLDFYIRLPEEIPNSRLAPIKPVNMATAIFKVPLSLTLAAMNPRSHIRRALWASLYPLDEERIYARNLEIPSGGGVGTARAIARAYGEFATGGQRLGLKEKTIKELMAPAVPPLHGFHDEVLKVEAQFSLGFAKPTAENPFGHPSSFGAPGSGGSFGFADPEAQIGYGYVPNRMDSYLMDPRDQALRRAMYRSIGEPDPYH